MTIPESYFKQQDANIINRLDAVGNDAGNKIKESIDQLYEMQQPLPNDVYWDDLKFPATPALAGFVVSSFEPAYDNTNNGLLFPQNDATQISRLIAQFPHERKNGSNIRPHIHFVQTGADEPVFKMNYRWYKNGGDPTVDFTEVEASTFAFTYPGSGSILQIASFPEIDGSAIDTVSSIMDIQIFRDDNVVSGNVLLKEFDIHYQIDAFGSRQEFIK
jgi:hypothetical protein